MYEAPAKDDGFRVLVDRVWPRGVSKKEARVDLWLREVAPSNDLRKWFGHQPDKWQEFKKRYFEELRWRTEEVEELVRKANEGQLTLIYSAKDTKHNQAVALKEFLENSGILDMS